MNLHTSKARLTLEPTISAPTAETGLRAAPAAADFVGVHTGWQEASQSHRSWQRAPEEEHTTAPRGGALVPPTSHGS